MPIRSTLKGGIRFDFGNRAVEKVKNELKGRQRVQLKKET